MHAVKKKEPEIILPKKIPVKKFPIKKQQQAVAAPPPPAAVSGTAASGAAVGVTVGRH